MSAYESQEWEGFEFQESGLGEWESHEWESGENEWEQEQFLGGILSSVLGGETESSQMEMELTHELLEVTSEEELEQFLGNLIKRAGKAVGGFIKSPVGKALGGALKGIAKKALPVAAGALGNLVVPGVGGMIGSKLGSMATKLFEVELEGMSEQQAEFEVARRYVRFATAAARNAARAPAGAPPRAVARAALISAARRHAPGLVRGGRPGSGPRPRFRPRRGGGSVSDFAYSTNGSGQDWADDDGFAGDEDGGEARREGRWIRRGRKILIIGA
ncbi:hypothetical protein Rhe02_49840 [Rhizocola hellebori]|uniref:Uncharacterized protein n=1 Tax=Rhizocola hellebori TaxID=1392758 RepID=A0A8J3QBN1_9ACTN|nr:hypothetical protein [Rhizocola hellebori]GIH06917.1 hypothetical protein Rhe02_49840 [Rhizocola hellebori]